MQYPDTAEAKLWQGGNMKVLFVTDLHGCRWKYDRLPVLAEEAEATVVINAGDMLPNDCDLHQQGDFIRRYLEEHFARFKDAGTHYLCYLGNDDLRIFDPLFEQVCGKFRHVHDIAQNKVALWDYEFVGMNWVLDYPFRLKDRCRMDTADYQFQAQLGTGVLSMPEGWEELSDWQAHARTLPTIEDELSSLPRPTVAAKAVYVVHMPPAGIGLDVCYSGNAVGSIALTRFLEKNQPLVSLHGHIHESPEGTGTWQARIGKTLCIQPGQVGGLCYAVIDLEHMEAERFLSE